jgi:hypothetical protein
MQRLILCALFMVPALLVLTTTPGCSKKDADKKAIAKKNGGDTDKKADKKGDGDGEALTALDAKLDGTITGTVIFDGDPPALIPEPAIKGNKNEKQCLMGTEREKSKQTWLVDPKTKAVANVVVWLEPPAGKYFKLADEDKKRTDTIVMDQPHCAFKPHVVALFPKYFDGKMSASGDKELVKTGQKFVIKNGSTFQHNSKWDADGVINKKFNETINAGDKREPVLNPQDEPLQIGCNFHQWMNGFIWIFDNPYNAVTKEDGTFSIKNVPTGVELTVVGWHEAKQKFFTKKMTFKKGENKLDDLKISK